MTRTERIAKFVYELKYEDLPPEVVLADKNMIMDTLSVAVGTTHVAPADAKAIWDTVEHYGGTPAATALVTGKKMPAGFAGMANATLAHGLDFDDTHKESLCHTGASAVTASLAMVEELKGTGRDLILAAVICFELSVRIGMSVMPSHYARGWHSTGTHPTIAIAAMSAKLLGCDEEGIIRAMALACSRVGGLLAYLDTGTADGSMNPGQAVFNGLLSGWAAKVGTTAQPEALEHQYGYCHVYCDEAPKLEKLDEGLGETWEILNNLPKFYPSLLASHCPIETTLRMVEQHDIKPEQIKKITELTYNTVRTHFSNYAPESTMAAQFSVPYLIAAAAARGKMDLDSVTLETIKSEAVQTMLGKVEIVSTPEVSAMYPEKFPAIVTIELEDGTVYRDEQYYPKGDPMHPATQEEREDKFRMLMGYTFTQEHTEMALRVCKDLESVTDIDGFAQLFVKKEGQ